MQSIIPLIIIGLFVYLMYSRKGGIGCCGGHFGHDSKRPRDKHAEIPPSEALGNVIDLNITF